MTTYRDCLGCPAPKASVSLCGSNYGVGGYWTIDSACQEIHRAGGKHATKDDAVGTLAALGWIVTDDDTDRYGWGCVSLLHPDTQSELDRLVAASDDKWRGASPCYVRLGDLPASGRSRNHADGSNEAGVSVYHGEILPTGEARPLPRHNAELCGLLTMLAERPMYVVTGDEIGTGSDGEPLLANCKIVSPVAAR